jgi:hypothetical protein
VVVLTFIFYIFLKLMMCHMIIGCCKRASLYQDLIVGALISILSQHDAPATQIHDFSFDTIC